MARRKKVTLNRKTGVRRYRNLCWISTEGTGTERDYFSMDVFSGRGMSVKFPKNLRPKKREPRTPRHWWTGE